MSELDKAKAEIAKLNKVIEDLERKLTRGSRSHHSLESLLADRHKPSGLSYLEQWELKYPGIDIEDELVDAWDHKARLKRKDMARYCDKWLKTAHGHFKARNRLQNPQDVRHEVAPSNPMRDRTEALRRAHAERERQVNDDFDPDYVSGLLRKMARKDNPDEYE